MSRGFNSRFCENLRRSAQLKSCFLRNVNTQLPSQSRFPEADSNFSHEMYCRLLSGLVVELVAAEIKGLPTRNRRQDRKKQREYKGGIQTEKRQDKSRGQMLDQPHTQNNRDGYCKNRTSDEPW